MLDYFSQMFVFPDKYESWKLRRISINSIVFTRRPIF